MQNQTKTEKNRKNILENTAKLSGRTDMTNIKKGNKETINAIFGYDKEKKELMQLRKCLLNVDKYRESGVHIPRGLLIYGAPGVGKTVMANAIADESINVVEVRAADCSNDDTAQFIQDSFQTAVNNTPCIVLLDELDKIAGSSMNFYMQDSDVLMRVLLQELDSIKENSGVLIVATCNNMENLNPALVRAGRFDRMLQIGMPKEKDRKLILQNYLDKIKVRREVDCDELARITSGFSGAQLECIANESGIVAMDKDEPIITYDDIRKVINRLEFDSSESDEQQDKWKVAVHEAGHAIVALTLCPDCLYGASIISQGNAEGHVQVIYPEKQSDSLKQAENYVTMLLAGRVAEMELLHESFLGSRSDIRRAYDKVYSLLDGGMYGYQYMTRRSDTPYGRSLTQTPADKTTNKLASILQTLEERAVKIVREKVSLLEKIAKALQSKLVLSRDELLRIAS